MNLPLLKKVQLKVWNQTNCQKYDPRTNLFWSFTCMQFSVWHSMHSSSTLLPRGSNRNLEWWHFRVVYIHRYGERSYFHQTNAILMDWEICTKKSTKITPRTSFRCRKSKFTVGFHCSRHCTYLQILSALKQMLNCCQLIIVSLEQANDGCVYEMFLPYHVLLGPTTIWRYKIGR